MLILRILSLEPAHGYAIARRLEQISRDTLQVNQLAYLVGQRTREIAVRRAVGAGTADVIGLVVGQGMRLVLVGLFLGIAGALAAARLLAGFLFEISPWNSSSWWIRGCARRGGRASRACASS